MTESPRLPDSPLTDPDAQDVDLRGKTWRRIALSVAAVFLGLYVLMAGVIFAYAVNTTGGLSHIGWGGAVFPALLPGSGLVLGLLLLLLALRRDGAGRVASAAVVVLAPLFGAGHLHLLGESGGETALEVFCVAHLVADCLLLLVALVRRRRWAWVIAGVAALVMGAGPGALLLEFSSGGPPLTSLQPWVTAFILCFMPMAGALTVIGLVVTMPKDRPVGPDDA